MRVAMEDFDRRRLAVDADSKGLWAVLFGRVEPTGRLSAATITGNVFEDLNNNQKLDGNEPGLSGWTVYIALNNGLTYQAGDSTATTNASGQFTFSGLLPGTYPLCVEPKTGWIQTTSASLGQQLVASAGQTLGDIEFGERLAAVGMRPPRLP